MNRHILYILVFVLLLLSIGAERAAADWVNFSGAENAPNIAEIHVFDDHVSVQLEIFVSDIVTFDRLIPESFFKDTDIDRPPLDARLQRFSNEDFQIMTENGRHLQAQLKRVEPRYRKTRPSPFAGKINPFTRERIPGPPRRQTGVVR